MLDLHDVSTAEPAMSSDTHGAKGGSPRRQGDPELWERDAATPCKSKPLFPHVLDIIKFEIASRSRKMSW